MFFTALIARIFTCTGKYATRRNWLFFLTFIRGLQLPALAWLIGQTINEPIVHKDLPRIYLHAGMYLLLVLLMVTTLHFRGRFALELGEAVAVGGPSRFKLRLEPPNRIFVLPPLFGKLW